MGAGLPHVLSKNTLVDMEDVQAPNQFLLARKTIISDNCDLLTGRYGLTGTDDRVIYVRKKKMYAVTLFEHDV